MQIGFGLSAPDQQTGLSEPPCDNARVPNSPDNCWLSGALLVLFRWTQGEVCEKSLMVALRVMQIAQDQIRRFFIDHEESVVRSDAPDFEESVTTVKNCSAMNFAARPGK
jgi:hypothetical protein